MSQWAGATLYLRVNDGLRDIYVPQGFSVSQQPHACWKLKRDQATGKLFFVNLAGLGKKWKLPDIYEARNAIFLRGYDDMTSRRNASESPGDSRHQLPQYGSHLLQPGVAAPNDRRYSATSFDAGSPAAVPRPNAPTPVRTQTSYLSTTLGDADPSGAMNFSPVPHQPETAAMAQPPDGHTADGSYYGVSHAEPMPAYTDPPRSTAPAYDPLADIRAYQLPPDAVPAASYGEEDDWGKFSSAFATNAKLEAQRREEERQAALRAEEQRLAEMASRYQLDIFGDPEAEGRFPSPERLRAQRDAEVLLEQHRLDERARIADVYRSSSAVEAAQKQRDASYTRDLAAIDALERQQLQLIRDHTLSLVGQAPQHQTQQVPPQQLQQPRTANSSRPSSDAGGWDYWEGAPNPRSAAASAPPPPLRGNDTMPVAVRAQDSVNSVDGPAWKLMSEQLEFHRIRADKLSEELAERERVILDFKLADAERERREIALRVRMVEAMAAYRERLALLDEEESDAKNRAVAVRTSNWSGAGGRGSSASPSVPRHPLYEADLVADY